MVRKEEEGKCQCPSPVKPSCCHVVAFINTKQLKPINAPPLILVINTMIDYSVLFIFLSRVEKLSVTKNSDQCEA